MKTFLILLLVELAFANAYTQKLPNKQETSLRIPANLKIDGKAKEWNNNFQAYSPKTDFFYTIANDDDELYLVIQAKDSYVFNKIIDRGLTLYVKNTKTGADVNFTFPYNSTRGRLSSSFGIDQPASRYSEEQITTYNRLLKDNHKFIKVNGVEGVDSLVSIYNDIGIQAAELFDNKKVYTLEMAIKLKLIGLSASEGGKFSYKLKVNSVEGVKTTTNMSMLNSNEITPSVRETILAEINLRYAKMYIGNDFEGEYSLAK